jgi:hypothetical protein
VRPAFWNIVSLGLPVAACLIGLLILSSSNRGTGDYAGSLGGGVLFLFGMGAVCAAGEVAAIAALARSERMFGLSILGTLLNGAVILPLLYLLSRAD